MSTSAQPPSPARAVPVSPIEARAVDLEVELLRKTFGIFKISTGAITFQWRTGATSQRSLDMKWVNTLCASFRSNGLQRVSPGHHIVATVERSAFEEAVRHTITLGYADPTLPLDLKTLPDDRPVPYAELRFPDGSEVEGQSGQHRVAALRKYLTDTNTSSNEDWWIVRLVDKGSRLLSMTLYARR
jgi:hypothetical protein